MSLYIAYIAFICTPHFADVNASANDFGDSSYLFIYSIFLLPGRRSGSQLWTTTVSQQQSSKEQQGALEQQSSKEQQGASQQQSSKELPLTFPSASYFVVYWYEINSFCISYFFLIYVPAKLIGSAKVWWTFWVWTIVI